LSLTLEQARDNKYFLPLGAFAALPYHEKGHAHRENQALLSLRRRDGDVAVLEDFLSAKGIRRMRPYAWGLNAFLGYTTRDQLVRITPTGYDLPYGEEADRPDCPRVLGAIQRYRIDGCSPGKGWKIEILNEVRQKAPPEEEAKDLDDLRMFLAHLGFYVWDPKVENVHRLSDGTPIFVDPDTVRKPDPDDENEQSSVRYHAARYRNQPDPPYYWGEKTDRNTWKQVKEFPQLDPASPFFGKFMGVVDASELLHLEESLGRDHPLVAAIRDEGLYPDQLLPEQQALLYRSLPPASVVTADVTRAPSAPSQSGHAGPR